MLLGILPYSHIIFEIYSVCNNDNPCLKMFRVTAKVAVSNSITSEISGSFILMMCLYLWPMLLLVVGWIIVFLFSEVSPSSIYVNYNASKIVQLELYPNMS